MHSTSAIPQTSAFSALYFGHPRGTMPPVTHFLVLRCSLDKSLESPGMLGMHFVFSLIYMMMTLTSARSLHVQLFGVNIHREPPPTLDAHEHNSLKFYKNDGKTVVDDPVDDSGFSLSDHLLPKKSFSHSSLDMADSSADQDDPLCNTIAEVYGPPTKRQCIEFTDLLAVASEDVDTVVSLPRPSPPPPPSGDSSKTSAQTLVPDDLPAPMTPTPPVDVPASTTDLGHDNDPEEPIPISTTADAVEQPEDCPAEVFEDTTHHLDHLAEDDPQDDLFEKVTVHGWDNGILLLEVEWKTGVTSSLPFTLVKRDYPYGVAQYI